MKKLLVGLLIVGSLGFAIDGAKGIGAGNSNLELEYSSISVLGYSVSGLGVAYNMGINNDLTGFVKMESVDGSSAFGGGLSYAFLNEKNGDDISLAGTVSLLLNDGDSLMVPSVKVSKELDELTVLGEFATYTQSEITVSQISGGAVLELTDTVALSGLFSTITMSLAGESLSGSGISFGVNIKL